MLLTLPGGGFAKIADTSSNPTLLIKSTGMPVLLAIESLFRADNIFLNSSNADSTSISNAQRFTSVTTGTISPLCNGICNASPRLCAGSVETINVFKLLSDAEGRLHSR